MSMGEAGAEAVRLRIREEMDRKHLALRELAQLIEMPVSTLGHILSGYSEMRVPDLFLICWGVGISPVEAVRDRGTEFAAELQPSHLRIIERLKQLPHLVDPVMLMLNVAHHTAPQGRRAARIVKKRSN